MDVADVGLRLLAGRLGRAGAREDLARALVLRDLRDLGLDPHLVDERLGEELQGGDAPQLDGGRRVHQDPVARRGQVDLAHARVLEEGEHELAVATQGRHLLAQLLGAAPAQVVLGQLQHDALDLVGPLQLGQPHDGAHVLALVPLARDLDPLEAGRLDEGGEGLVGHVDEHAAAGVGVAGALLGGQGAVRRARRLLAAAEPQVEPQAHQHLQVAAAGRLGRAEPALHRLHVGEQRHAVERSHNGPAAQIDEVVLAEHRARRQLEPPVAQRPRRRLDVERADQPLARVPPGRLEHVPPGCLPLTFLGAIVVGPHRGLPGRLPAGHNQYLAGLRPAAAVIILFIVLLVLPNPRLRTRSQLREFFPAPTASGLRPARWVRRSSAARAGHHRVDATDQITYGQIFSLGIVALSLVPAGRATPARSRSRQLSFAGIGAIAAGHHWPGRQPARHPARRASSPRSSAGSSRSRCCGSPASTSRWPRPRSRVALDRWIFNLPDFDLGPVHISLFELGSTERRPADAVRLRVRHPALAADALGRARSRSWPLLVVAVRREPRSAGRSSPCTTARPPAPRSASTCSGPGSAVFMLSAGIAGLGGALYGMQLGADLAGALQPGHRPPDLRAGGRRRRRAGRRRAVRRDRASTACCPLTSALGPLVARSTRSRPASPASGSAATRAACVPPCQRGRGARCGETGRCSSG